MLVGTCSQGTSSKYWRRCENRLLVCSIREEETWGQLSRKFDSDPVDTSYLRAHSLCHVLKASAVSLLPWIFCMTLLPLHVRFHIPAAGVRARHMRVFDDTYCTEIHQGEYSSSLLPDGSFGVMSFTYLFHIQQARDNSENNA